MTDRQNQALAEAFADLGQACARIAAALLDLERTETSAEKQASSPAVSEGAPTPVPSPKRDQKPLVITGADDEPEGLSKTGRKILVALAQFDRSMNRPQLGVMTGLSATTGPFGVALAQLRRDGLIDGGGAAMTITARGRLEVGDYAPLPTGHALFEYWANKLGSTQAKVLRALRSSQESMSKADLGAATGLSHSTGPFGVALAELRRMQLIAGGGSGMQLSPDFRRAIEPTISVFDKGSGRTVKVDRATGHAR